MRDGSFNRKLNHKYINDLQGLGEAAGKSTLTGKVIRDLYQ
jgi:hypothetical protein